MDFCRTGIADQRYNSRTGCTTDDGIIHQNHPLAPQFTFHGAELNFHLIHPVILTGGDEGTPDILIFD